ncbi:MAG: phosphatidylglycerol lysyltransferase domain-containing protein [Verrucomicrobiota bacterium]
MKPNLYPATLPENEVEEFSYEYGATYDSYLINDGNRVIFRSKAANGLLGYVIDKDRYVHVIGGLLAQGEEEKTRLLEEFLELSKQRNFKTVLFHNILEEDLPLFQRFGVEATKCGEEALISLQETDWLGHQYEWVRRQESYGRRKGLQAEEVLIDSISRQIDLEIATELQSISDAHIQATTAGTEFSYFAGRLLLEDCKRKRIFIARRKEHIEAFIICNPGQGGSFYAIEMYRYRRSAPRGTMPFLWMSALRQLKSEGVEAASLCMMPFYNCGQKHPLDNGFLRCMNDFWFRHLNWLFNAKGLYHFKSRFRPTGRSMFTVCYPKTSLAGLCSAFALWELSSVISIRFIFGQAFRKLKRRRPTTVKS